jgi:hypothetical protein
MTTTRRDLLAAGLTTAVGVVAAPNFAGASENDSDRDHQAVLAGPSPPVTSAYRLSGASMKCLRIYATPDGESHFGEAEIPLTMAPLFEKQAPFALSANYPASRIRFIHIPAGVTEVGWHNPPGRVLAVWPDGIVEFETSDGEVRRVSAGAFVLVEDTHGKGHMSRHPKEGQYNILITLPDGLDLVS